MAGASENQKCIQFKQELLSRLRRLVKGFNINPKIPDQRQASQNQLHSKLQNNSSNNLNQKELSDIFATYMRAFDMGRISKTQTKDKELVVPQI